MALVVDASVGLKWVLDEADSPIAHALAEAEPDLLMPDFWLNEATNIFWLQVRRRMWVAEEAREALSLLRAQVAPTPTGDLALHDVALDIGLEVNLSTYDTLYVAFALAMGARHLVVAERARRHRRSQGVRPGARARLAARPSNRRRADRGIRQPHRWPFPPDPPAPRGHATGHVIQRRLARDGGAWQIARRALLVAILPRPRPATQCRIEGWRVLIREAPRRRESQATALAAG